MGTAILVAYCVYFLAALVVGSVLVRRKDRWGIGLIVFSVVLGGYTPVRMALHRPQYYWDGSSTAMDVGCECITILLTLGPFT